MRVTPARERGNETRRGPKTRLSPETQVRTRPDWLKIAGGVDPDTAEGCRSIDFLPFNRADSVNPQSIDVHLREGFGDGYESASTRGPSMADRDEDCRPTSFLLEMTTTSDARSPSSPFVRAHSVL